MSLYGIRKLCKNTILQSRTLCIGLGLDYFLEHKSWNGG